MAKDIILKTIESWLIEEVLEAEFMDNGKPVKYLEIYAKKFENGKTATIQERFTGSIANREVLKAYIGKVATLNVERKIAGQRFSAVIEEE